MHVHSNISFERQYACVQNTYYTITVFTDSQKDVHRLLWYLDIDECQDHTLNKCENPQKCSNAPGSYRCYCPDGYKKKGKFSCTGKCLYIYKKFSVSEAFTKNTMADV